MLSGRRIISWTFKIAAAWTALFWESSSGGPEVKEIRRRRSPHALNLRGRNLETVQNLGIHKIAEISSEETPSDLNGLNELKNGQVNGTACSETIYQAHKTLMELNEKIRECSATGKFPERQKEIPPKRIRFGDECSSLPFDRSNRGNSGCLYLRQMYKRKLLALRDEKIALKREKIIVEFMHNLLWPSGRSGPQRFVPASYTRR